MFIYGNHHVHLQLSRWTFFALDKYWHRHNERDAFLYGNQCVQLDEQIVLSCSSTVNIFWLDKYRLAISKQTHVPPLFPQKGPWHPFFFHPKMVYEKLNQQKNVLCKTPIGKKMFYAKPCCVFKNVLPGYAINSVVPESAPPTPQHWFHRANCILIRYLLPYTYWRRVSIQDVFCAWHFKNHAGRSQYGGGEGVHPGRFSFFSPQIKGLRVTVSHADRL